MFLLSEKIIDIIKNPDIHQYGPIFEISKLIKNSDEEYSMIMLQCYLVKNIKIAHHYTNQIYIFSNGKKEIWNKIEDIILENKDKNKKQKYIENIKKWYYDEIKLNNLINEKESLKKLEKYKNIN